MNLKLDFAIQFQMHLSNFVTSLLSLCLIHSLLSIQRLLPLCSMFYSFAMRSKFLFSKQSKPFTHSSAQYKRENWKWKKLSYTIWSRRCLQFFIKFIHCKFLLLIFSLVNWKIWDFYIWCDINIRSLLNLSLCTVSSLKASILLLHNSKWTRKEGKQDFFFLGWRAEGELG